MHAVIADKLQEEQAKYARNTLPHCQNLGTCTLVSGGMLPAIVTQSSLLVGADLDADQVSCDSLCSWGQHWGNHQWHRPLPEGHEPQHQGDAARPCGQCLLGLLGQPHRSEGAQAQVLPGSAPFHASPSFPQLRDCLAHTAVAVRTLWFLMVEVGWVVAPKMGHALLP